MKSIISKNERRRISRKKWADAHPEETKRAIHNWQKRNKERVLAAQRRWRDRNIEKERERVRKWFSEHKEKNREYGRNYRAKKSGNGGSFTNKEWKEMKDKYGNICLRCGSSDKIEMDHIVPLSKGGLHSAENIQPLCKRCNAGKRDKTVDYRQGKQDEFEAN